ncbi:uncharacterized protein LOC122073385 [Macadamia integrifolia]|uniref:uncharacterized protein LOC122073385 n=1 Tax=Macadamia integrifolia TaxID=60698 RepID=UPI001C4F9FD1|nr:uncharacterized protein LOC122073385 [Macadamia integrifolia]
MHFRLQIADCRLQIADCKLEIGDWSLYTPKLMGCIVDSNERCVKREPIVEERKHLIIVVGGTGDELTKLEVQGSASLNWVEAGWNNGMVFLIVTIICAPSRLTT